METYLDYDERRRIQNLLAQRRRRQKNGLRQGLASHSGQNHGRLDGELHDHDAQKSSYSVVFESTKPASVYQRPPPLQNPLVSRGYTQQDPIVSSAAGVMGSFSTDGYLPETPVPRSSVPFDCDICSSKTIHDIDPSSSGHLENGLTLGIGQVLGYGHAEKIPGIPLGQTVDINSPHQSMSTYKDQIEKLSADVFEDWTQDGVATHSDDKESIRDQIIDSLRRAENLYEYGIMMRLFPSDSSFCKVLADAQCQLQSTSARYNSQSWSDECFRMPLN